MSEVSLKSPKVTVNIVNIRNQHGFSHPKLTAGCFLYARTALDLSMGHKVVTLCTQSSNTVSAIHITAEPVSGLESVEHG